MSSWKKPLLQPELSTHSSAGTQASANALQLQSKRSWWLQFFGWLYLISRICPPPKYSSIPSSSPSTWNLSCFQPPPPVSKRKGASSLSPDVNSYQGFGPTLPHVPWEKRNRCLHGRFCSWPQKTIALACNRKHDTSFHTQRGWVSAVNYKLSSTVQLQNWVFFWK